MLTSRVIKRRRAFRFRVVGFRVYGVWGLVVLGFRGAFRFRAVGLWV